MNLIKQRKKNVIKSKKKYEKNLLKNLKKEYIKGSYSLAVYGEKDLKILCKYLDKHKIKYKTSSMETYTHFIYFID